jgi:thiosulfate reductase cytochrome b subunit
MSQHAAMKKIYLYTRFERFWHWLQALMIIILLGTGLEIHGVYALFGFEEAVELHNFVGLSWLVLFVFIIFWLLTTGEWKQYVPTTRKLLQMVHYYGVGMFRGDPHPAPKSKGAKHNPLQRLTYLGLAAVLLPVQMLSGLLYYSYNSWSEWGLGWLNLGAVAFVHMAGAFAILSFLIVHLYMTTTGHTITAHLSAMVSGYDEVPQDYEVQDWEQPDRP